MNQLAPIAASLPAEVSGRLAAWAVEARHALSDSTQRGYASDSRIFADWCAEQGIASLPASPEAVAAFLRHDSGKAVATIRRRAATISQMHRAAGLPNPCEHELVRLALKGLARTRGTDQRQAAPITQRDADIIRGGIGDTLKDARDLALMLVGRDLLARSSELVAITVDAITAVEDGALVSLRRRKTSTETIEYFIGLEAAQALDAWIERAGITEGPVFQSLRKNGKPTGRALDTRDVRRILKGRAQDARLGHADGVSGHSLRVGMAQDLVAADLDVASVMQAGGWASPTMVARYSSRITARRGAVARFYAKAS
jgi:integrase